MTLRELTLRLSLSLALTSPALAAEPRPRHPLPVSKDGNLVVGLCDGETAVEVEGVKPGETLSREQAATVADQLMREWRKKNPRARWDDGARLAQVSRSATRPKEAVKVDPAKQPLREAVDTASAGALQIPAASPHLQTGHTYGAFSARDEAIWKASTEAFVERGHAVFHDAKELGGTIAVSCDMCHPDASNTHPETYPKYQVQLGRVALLRDMINWCIENPVRGKPLPDDDERLRAMEAYIYAKRKGTPLQYGKH